MRIAVAGGTGLIGRHVVHHAERRGHDVVVLSRSRGVDVRTGDGLADALAGAGAVVDVTNAGTTEQGAATAFFADVSRNLQKVGAEQDVRHVVTLSIVGVDRVPAGYFAAKLAHERAAASGPVGSTILRATQFHEFAGQLVAWSRDGARARVPDLAVQTVAARTVAAALVELAERAPAGRARDLAGPERSQLVTLARRLVAHRGEGIDVQVDTDAFADVPPGALLPDGDARVDGPTFDQWLHSHDATALVL